MDFSSLSELSCHYQETVEHAAGARRACAAVEQALWDADRERKRGNLRVLGLPWLKGTFNTECYIRKSTGSQVIGVWTAELSRGRVMGASVRRQQVKIEALDGDSSGAESLLGMCEALRSTPSTTEIRTKSSRHRSSKTKDRNMLGI